MKKDSPLILRIIVYLIGITIIALGINVSKMSALGISPVSSIPGAINAKFPSVSLGGAVIIIYIILVLLQLAVLRKNFKPISFLGVPISIIFGIIVDFIGNKEFLINIAGIPLSQHKFHGLLENFPTPQNVVMQFVYLILSMIIIGIGVSIYLKPKLTPMPAEGLAAAISELTGKVFGNCKTAVDVGLITTAAVFQLITFGVGSFMIGKGVVGIGTIISGFCVGQIVKFINKISKKLFNI